MARWMPRGWAWVDPVKEVSAYKDAVRCGFKTLGQIVAEQGGDLDELLLQRQAELQKLADMGIVVDTDPTQVDDNGAIQVPPTAPPDEDDSDD